MSVGQRPTGSKGSRAGSRRIVLGGLALRLGSLVAGSVLAVGVGEAAVRLLVPQVDVEQWFESSERYGHQLKPNFRQTYRYAEAGVVVEVRTNSLRFRGDETPDLTEPGLRRILLLGDSFTFGEGLNVDYIFATILEVMLNEAGRRYQVINAGVGGWGTLQETRHARDHLEQLRPDVIVLTFCGNDPDDDVNFMERRVDNEKGRFYFPGKIWIRNHSQLYGLVYRSTETLRRRRQVNNRLRTHPELVIDPQSSTLIDEGQWKLTLERIRSFHEDFLKFNPRGIVLIQATYPLNENVRTHLRTLSDGTSRFYVDLHDRVERLGPGKLRLPYDGHWTEAMHAISAKALHDEIVTRLAQPPSAYR